jgi:hypothetical protein
MVILDFYAFKRRKQITLKGGLLVNSTKSMVVVRVVQTCLIGHTQKDMLEHGHGAEQMLAGAHNYKECNISKGEAIMEQLISICN